MSQATSIKEAAIPHPPIVKHIAPAFMGAGFGTVVSPAVPPNFWSAIRHDVTRGGLVVQLGGQGNQPVGSYSYAMAYAGFQYVFKASETPPAYVNHVFRVRFNTGPVTVRNTGGNRVIPFCQIQFEDYVPLQQPASNTPLTMYADGFLDPGATYKVIVKCGVQLIRSNPTIAPYGEVIIKDTDLELTRYWDGENTPPGGMAKSAALMTESEPIVEEVGSIEEAQAKGLVGMF